MPANPSDVRELPLWDEDYVAALPVDELDWIEYKGSEKFNSPGWTHEMSKYVSAWANYDGGYIVFGIKNTGALEIDGGIPESIKPKLGDWLDTVVPNLVEPPVQEVTSWLIRPKGPSSRIKPGHVLIAVHIPPSDVAPHQAADHKYYQRLGRRLEPLQHRAITDIVGRRRFPQLRTTITIHPDPRLKSPFVFWKLENIGSVLALHWMVIVRFPTMINDKSVGFKEKSVTIGETGDGKSFLEFRIQKLINYPPLFPQSDISASYEIGPVTYTPALKSSINEIRVTTYADGMSPLEEVIQLADALRKR